MKKNSVMTLFFVIMSVLFIGMSNAMEKERYTIEQEPVVTTPNQLLEILEKINQNNNNFLSNYDLQEEKFENFKRYAQQIQERTNTLKKETHSPFTLKVLTYVGSLIVTEYEKLTPKNNLYYNNHISSLENLQKLYTQNQ